jgi:hypothetical protein
MAKRLSDSLFRRTLQQLVRFTSKSFTTNGLGRAMAV